MTKSNYNLRNFDEPLSGLLGPNGEPERRFPEAKSLSLESVNRLAMRSKIDGLRQTVDWIIVLGEELRQIAVAHGVDLTMASTFLRFRNSAVFQIIDRHAYRALYGKDYPLYTQTSLKRKIEVYFTFLDDLRLLCESKILPFEIVDRVLYVFDKDRNGSLSKGTDEALTRTAVFGMLKPASPQSARSSSAPQSRPGVPTSNQLQAHRPRLPPRQLPGATSASANKPTGQRTGR